MIPRTTLSSGLVLDFKSDPQSLERLEAAIQSEIEAIFDAVLGEMQP